MEPGHRRFAAREDAHPELPLDPRGSTRSARRRNWLGACSSQDHAPERIRAHIGILVLTPRPTDVAIWSELLPEVLSGKMEPDGRAERRLEPEQVGAFRFFAGTALAARADARARAWLG